MCIRDRIYDSNTYEKDYVYLGITGKADENGVFDLEQKNKFSVGEIIEIMKPDGRNIETVVEGIWDLEGNEQESAPHARQALKEMCIRDRSMCLQALPAHLINLQ